MTCMTVNAVRRDEPYDVECVPVALTSRHCVDKCLFLEKVPVFDALVDARQILIDDATGAHGDVADLRVAHLSVRKADILARRLKRRMRVAIEQFEIGWCARQLD